MSFDTHSLFAFSFVSQVISQNSTTLVVKVQTGNGALFNSPQQITVGPSTGLFSKSTAMAARLTGLSGDQLTIDITSGSREGSSVRTVQVGDLIGNFVTPKWFTDIETQVTTILGDLPSGAIVGTSDAQTLTNKTLEAPIIEDTNGNTILSLSHTASAVNNVQVTNEPTGTDPQIIPVGSDSNRNLDLRGKGNGVTLLEGIRQDLSSGVTTSQYKPRIIIQYGWFYITGDGSTSEFDFAITFPKAFSAAEYSITFGGLNGLAASDPSSQAALGTTVGTTTNPNCAIKSQVNSSCSVHLVFNGGAPGNGVRVGVNWIAVGTVT